MDKRCVSAQGLAGFLDGSNNNIVMPSPGFPKDRSPLIHYLKDDVENLRTKIVIAC